MKTFMFDIVRGREIIEGQFVEVFIETLTVSGETIDIGLFIVELETL